MEAKCYLIAGDTDRGMDVLEAAEPATLLLNWYGIGKWPWFKWLEGNERYDQLMSTLDTLWAEQRALLAELEAEPPGQI